MTREVPADEFLDLFRQAKSDVFRLELRDRYNVPAEHDRWEAFQARDWPRLEELNKAQRAVWMQLMRDVTSTGRRVERVRVITEPPTRYIQFELLLNAGNAEAGEDIRYLPRDHAQELALPSVDYWLFDSTAAVVLQFGDDDDLLGMELVDEPATINGFCAGRDSAWHHAVPYSTYATKWVYLAESPPGA
ncbi:DUF6879 family protein [Nonomuraea sp. B19D2]|uniref:DUF6879 family protein n=1 Tax=Nonomuraea sp. B19D2 TaxID=3159561 RepID=UPI0032D9E1D7